MNEKPHIFFGLIGGALGYAVATLASNSVGITQRWSWLFNPFWGYVLPIGLVAAGVGGIIASLLAPSRRGAATADLAAVAVCMALNLATLWPRLGLLFLLTIGYGFVGHIVGSIVGALKHDAVTDAE